MFSTLNCTLIVAIVVEGEIMIIRLPRYSQSLSQMFIIVCGLFQIDSTNMFLFQEWKVLKIISRRKSNEQTN